MFTRSRFVLSVCVCAVASVASVNAQGHESDVPALVGNRPGAVENRGTVGAGVLQLEGGFAVDFNPREESSPRDVTTPGGLVRFGVAKHIEARVGVEGFKYSSENVHGERVSSHGTSDLYVGAKMIVLDEHHAGVEFSVVPGLTLPTGSAALTSSAYDPSVTFAFAKELPLHFDATSAWSFAAPTIEEHRHREFEGSVALARPLTSRILVAAEVARHSSHEESPVWSTGAGLGFLVTPNIQADVQVAHDVRNASGWMFGGGLVVRRR